MYVGGHGVMAWATARAVWQPTSALDVRWVPAKHALQLRDRHRRSGRFRQRRLHRSVAAPVTTSANRTPRPPTASSSSVDVLVTGRSDAGSGASVGAGRGAPTVGSGEAAGGAAAMAATEGGACSEAAGGLDAAIGAPCRSMRLTRPRF